MSDEFHELLCAYSDLMRRNGYDNTAEVALRTQSRALRDVMAYVATHNRYSWQDLQQMLKLDGLPNITYRSEWLASLGRVCALQAFHAADIQEHARDLHFGLACLTFANRKLSKDRQFQHFHRLEIELLIRQNQLGDARALLEDTPSLKSAFYGYLLTDLHHPAISNTIDTHEEWLDGFNRPFVENGLTKIDLPRTTPNTFNELTTAPTLEQNEGPKVSVILTSYRPARQDILNAVSSILAQTYRNIELIIVDDASPPQFDEILEEIVSLDSRIRLIKLTKNGGTYRARNAAIAAATGKYVTGQDADDWSHPQRLAHQVAYLQDNPTASGVVVQAIRMNDELIRVFPGRLPQRLCEVSLMLPAEVARQLGGYIDARKGADSEFRRRLETRYARKVHLIEKPLYLTRIGHDSLSAADFKPGWSHPVRRAFWNATQHWHENALDEDLTLQESLRSPVPVPNRFKVVQPEDLPLYDVVFINDWRSYGLSQRIMLDQIRLLARAGKRVGLMHLESLLSPSKETTRLCKEVQNYINAGTVNEVIPDESAASEVGILSDPSILQFLSPGEISFTARQVFLMPALAPKPTANTQFLYLPEPCQRIAEDVFSGDVVWSSPDPAVRQNLAESSWDIPVLSEHCPPVLHVETWDHNRSKPSPHSPVIGTHTENLEALWPDNLDTVKRLWPATGTAEVRILGDARALLRKFGLKNYPIDWVVFRDQEIQPEAFMRSIDYFVYFPAGDLIQSFCREALEAAAAGTLVILPERFKEFHRESALYAEEDEVPALIAFFQKDTEAYYDHVRVQMRAANNVANNNDFTSFLEKNMKTSAISGLEKCETY